MHEESTAPKLEPTWSLRVIAIDAAPRSRGETEGRQERVAEVVITALALALTVFLLVCVHHAIGDIRLAPSGGESVMPGPAGSQVGTVGIRLIA